ncbi:serine-rich adhesin for platelets [Anabrus simplex]|uniref:serine-rich adhesin for platelets n=1 Tax=Anabrus simplex TaxID=316456 RepID=UPI0035A3607C
MCEQTEVSYLEGDIVWVKLGSCWWPGKVRDINNLDEEILESFRKRPIAAVQFFEEDKFEYVKSLEQICRYNCRRKNEFIKKGLDMYRTKQREGSSFMDKFPLDVAVAEKLTGGDPKILNDDIFAPEEKPDYRDIFGADKKNGDKKTPEKKNKFSTSSGRSPSVAWHGKVSPANVRRSQPSLSLPTHIITQRVINNLLKGDENEGTDNHVRIRHQPTSRFRKDPEPKEPYQCYLCDYNTTRLNVYILHHKRHSAEDRTNSINKKPGTPKSVTPVSSKSGRGRSRSAQSGGIESTKSQVDLSSSIPETPRSNASTHLKSSKAKVPNDSETSVEDKNVKEKSQFTEKKSPKTIFGKKRSLKSGADKGVKKKKSSEDFKEKLLADWGDVDPEAEEKEIEILKKALSESMSSKPSTSCFDFDEKADAILDSKHEERAKKFAETRKFSRFIEEKRDYEIKYDKESKQNCEKVKMNDVEVMDGNESTSRDSNDEKDKSLCETFDTVMAETELPSLPAVPDLPGASHRTGFVKTPSRQNVLGHDKVQRRPEFEGLPKTSSNNESLDIDDTENQSLHISDAPQEHNISNIAAASGPHKPAGHSVSTNFDEASAYNSLRNTDIIQFAKFSDHPEETNIHSDPSFLRVSDQHKLPESVSHKHALRDSACETNESSVPENPTHQEGPYVSRTLSQDKPVDMHIQSVCPDSSNHHEVLSHSNDSNSQKLLNHNASLDQCETIHLTDTSNHHKHHKFTSALGDQGNTEIYIHHSNQDSIKTAIRREIPGLIEISRRQDSANLSDPTSFPIDAKNIVNNKKDSNLASDETTIHHKDSDENSSTHPKDLEDEDDDDDDPNDDSVEHHKDIDDDDDDNDDAHDSYKDSDSASGFHKDVDDDHTSGCHKDIDDDGSNHKNVEDTSGHNKSISADSTLKEEDSLEIEDTVENCTEQPKGHNEEDSIDHLSEPVQSSSLEQSKEICEPEKHTKSEMTQPPNIHQEEQLQDHDDNLGHAETLKFHDNTISSHGELVQGESSGGLGSVSHVNTNGHREDLFHSDTHEENTNISSDDCKCKDDDESVNQSGSMGHNDKIFETMGSEETGISKASTHFESLDCDDVSNKELDHTITSECQERLSAVNNIELDNNDTSNSQSSKPADTNYRDPLDQIEATDNLVAHKSPTHHHALDLSETSVKSKNITVESYTESYTDLKNRQFTNNANLQNSSGCIQTDMHCKNLNHAPYPSDSDQVEHKTSSSHSINLDVPLSHHEESSLNKDGNDHDVPEFELNQEVIPSQSNVVSNKPSVSVVKERNECNIPHSLTSMGLNREQIVVENTLSSDTDHDYSTKHTEAHRIEIKQEPPERQVTSSEIDDEMELDINSMPVVMDDTVITDDASIKVVNDNTLPAPIPILAGDTLQVAGTSEVIVSQPLGATKIISSSAKSSVVKVIKPAIKTVKLHTGASTSTGCSLKTSEGATIVTTKGAMSGYVVIQPSQSGQPSFYSASKPLQQCLTLKSVAHSSQQQIGKKVVIVKSPQGTMQQEILTTGGKVTLPQRIVKSQGTVLKQVSGKTVMGRGSRFVPLTQQQVKAFTESGKQTFGPKLTMQSSQTKVVLPTMQSIKKITMPQSPVKMIGTGATKQKTNTILIQTTQSTAVSSSTTLPISQTIGRQNVPRPKVIATPSSGSSLQRVLASQPGRHSQTEVLAAQSMLQPRMVVHKVRSPGNGKTSNVSQIKRVSGIFPRSQVIHKNVSKTPSIHKIIPIQSQATRDDTQAPKVSQESSAQGSDALPTRHLPAFQPVQPEITVSPTISQSFQSSNSTVLSTAQSTVTTSVATMPVVSTSATSLLIPEQIAQVMASTTSDPSATYVLLSIEEPNSIQSFESPALLYDGTAQNSNSNTRTLIIDPAALTSYNNQDNIILAIPSHSAGSGTIMNLGQSNTGETRTSTAGTTPVFRTRGDGQSSGSATSNQDILAAALANTDVFQPEVSMQDTLTVVNSSQSTNGSVMTSRLLESSPPLLVSSSAAPLLLPSLTSVLPPTNTAGVLETSLTLSQPIMTPLEVPSSVTSLQPPPPVIPTSLELPLTITQPLNIPTQSSYTPLSLATSDPSVTNSQSIGKSFHPSMPLLSEEIPDSNISSESAVVLTSSGSIGVPHREVIPKMNSSFDSVAESSSQTAVRKSELEKDVKESSSQNPLGTASVQPYAQVPEISSHVVEEGGVSNDGSSLDHSVPKEHFKGAHAEESRSSSESDVQGTVEVTEHSEQAVSTSYSHSTSGISSKDDSEAIDSSLNEPSASTETSEAVALRDSSNGDQDGSLPYSQVESTSCLPENTECTSTCSRTAETSSHDVTTSQLHDMLAFSDSSADGSTSVSHSMPSLSDDAPSRVKRNLEDLVSENEESHLPIKRRKVVNERLKDQASLSPSPLPRPGPALHVDQRSNSSIINELKVNSSTGKHTRLRDAKEKEAARKNLLRLFNVSCDSTVADLEEETPTPEEKAKLNDICHCILNAVHQKPCRRHLEDILYCRVDCKRHKCFKNSTPDKKRQLALDTGLGPFDMDSGFQLMRELELLLKEVASEEKIKELGYSPDVYLLNVWVPEAILFSLKNVLNYSEEEAEALFFRTSSYL